MAPGAPSPMLARCQLEAQPPGRALPGAGAAAGYWHWQSLTFKTMSAEAGRTGTFLRPARPGAPADGGPCKQVASHPPRPRPADSGLAGHVRALLLVTEQPGPSRDYTSEPIASRARCDVPFDWERPSEQEFPQQERTGAKKRGRRERALKTRSHH